MRVKIFVFRNLFFLFLREVRRDLNLQNVKYWMRLFFYSLEMFQSKYVSVAP